MGNCFAVPRFYYDKPVSRYVPPVSPMTHSDNPYVYSKDYKWSKITEVSQETDASDQAGTEMEPLSI